MWKALMREWEVQVRFDSDASGKLLARRSKPFESRGKESLSSGSESVLYSLSKLAVIRAKTAHHSKKVVLITSRQICEAMYQI